MKFARALTAGLIGALAIGTSWGRPPQRGLRAVVDLQTQPTVPATTSPLSAQSVVQSPAVFLFRSGPERTGSISKKPSPRSARSCSGQRGFPIIWVNSYLPMV